MLWIETPTNPLVKYVDVKRACEIAHQHDITVVVDNTFRTPYFQVREGIIALRDGTAVATGYDPMTARHFCTETTRPGCRYRDEFANEIL